MTILLMDGFETYGDTGTSEADIESRLDNTDGVVHTSGSSVGSDELNIITDFDTVGYALQFPRLQGNANSHVSYEWPAAYRATGSATSDEFVVGFRFYNGRLEADNGIDFTCFLFRINTGGNPGSTAGGLLTNTTSGNTDLIWQPASGATTTASNVLTVNTWHYIEIRYLPKQSTGTVQVFVDGSNVIDLTGQSVMTFNFFTHFGFRLGPGMSAAANNDDATAEPFAYDDVYGMVLDGVDHTDELGASRVFALKPSSDASPNDWAPDTGGTNYTRINNEDWETASYVEADTNGDDDHYSLDTLVATDTVHAVQIDCVCEATDGTPNLHLGFDNGTADETDVGTIATGGEVQKRTLFQEDPEASSWDTASVNAVEATQRMTE